VERAAADFAAISSHGVMQGCIGALDGLLIKANTPSQNEVPHVKSCHSGLPSNLQQFVQIHLSVNRITWRAK
jgi:hypothetical protein